MRCGRCGLEGAAGMRFCGSCGAPLGETLAIAPAEGASSDAQRRHMTVMFCDLVDSTALAEQLDPEDFRDVLSGYHAACAHAIERFNGYVAQYQGDGVVAYFGYPQAHEDDALRAVRASLEVLDGVSELSERLREMLSVSLGVRVGLHTGMVVAGEMGTGPTRERHAAVGETLHVAARVQSLAEPGSVVMTDATLELLAGRVESEPLGTRALKGISRPVAVHAVVRPSPGADPLEQAALRTTPLVDRSREREQLLEAWRSAERGRGGTVHLTGEAGIGKSRLVRALRDHVRERGAAERVLQCSPHHSSSALHPVIRFIEQLLDLDRTEPAEQQLRALERCLQAAGADTAEALAPLADVLSIGDRPQGAREVMPRDARNATLQALAALLTDGADEHPLLLVVEDLHWADPTTIELLERIVGGLASTRAVAVLTFRADFQPPWARWQAAGEIELGPLATGDVRELANAASAGELDPASLQRVETAAEGVPLFVEEMVKALAAGTAGGTGAASGVPPTLQGLLTERLDRLPQLAGVIDIAAVLGREADRGLMEALSPLDRHGFRSALAQLAAEDVLRPVEGSRTRLEFRHALLQEVAYDRLLRRRRRSLHERVAELLVAHSPSSWETEPERIAHHWSCAEQPERALAYWELAGRRAIKQAAFLEAAEHFRNAVRELDRTRPGTDGDGQRSELLTYIGVSLQAGSTPAADVREIFTRARSACERVGRHERIVPVIRGQYLFHVARAQYGEALGLADELLAMGQQSGRATWLAESRFYLGFARMMQGELGSGRADLEEACRLYEPPERGEQFFEAQSDPGVAALAYLANLLWNQGHAQEALDASERSLELADVVGGPVTLSLAWGMRCGLMLVAGRPTEFAGWLQKARTHSVERNIGYWSTVCSMWTVWVDGLRGDARAAGARLQQQLDAYLQAGGRVGVPHFRALLAEVHLAAGEQAAAADELQAAQEHIDATGERYYEPELQWLLARVLDSGPEPDAAAAAAYGRALAAATEQDARLLELRAATGLAIHQRRCGEPETAIARVRSLCSWFGVESRVPDAVRAMALLGGRPAAAEARPAAPEGRPAATPAQEPAGSAGAGPAG